MITSRGRPGRPLLLLLLLLLSAPGSLSGADNYVFREPSRDGTGKVYMGREIAHVMGHLGAGW